MRAACAAMRAPTGVNKPLSRSNAQHPDTEPVGGATGLDGGHDTASQCDNTAKPHAKPPMPAPPNRPNHYAAWPVRLHETAHSAMPNGPNGKAGWPRPAYFRPCAGLQFLFCKMAQPFISANNIYTT